MKESKKSREDLVSELEKLRNRVAELRESEAELKRAGEERRNRCDHLEKMLSLRTGELMMVSQQLQQNVAAHSKAKEDLQNASEILEKMFSNLHVLVAYMDTDFNFIRVNRAYAEADDREPEFFVGRNHFDLYPNEGNECIFRRVVETGEQYSVQAKPFVYPEHPERGVTYWDWSLSPVKGSSGEVEGLVFCLVDVTDRERAEEALRESEERYRLHFENVGDVVYLTDREMRIIDVSPSVQALIGYAPEEIIGRRIDELNLLEPEYFGRAINNTLRVLSGVKSGPTEYVFITKGGERKIGEIIGSPLIKEGEVVAVISVARDITARKKAEEELMRYREHLEKMVETRTAELTATNKLLQKEVAERKQAEAELRRQRDFSERLIDSSVEGIIAFDRELRYTLWNTAMEKLIGIREEDVLGKYVFDFFPFAEESDEQEGSLSDVIVSGRTVIVENRAYHIPGTGKKGFFDAHCSPLFSESGEIIGGLAIVRDMTERRQSEEALRESEARYRRLSESLEAMVRDQVRELRQAESLAAIGQMISAVAHEIRNPLQNIRMGVDAMRMELGEEKGKLDILKEIEYGVRLLGDTVNELLEYAKPVRLNYSSWTIRDIVKQSLNSMAAKLEGVDVCLELENEGKTVHLDAEKISRVLMNVVTNAVESMPGGGKLEIRSEFSDFGGTVLLKICISDTGCGIDEKDMERIQEPFFTTKTHGTGLGISICKKIVEAHSGNLKIRSRVSEGTTVEIYLPISPS